VFVLFLLGVLPLVGQSLFSALEERDRLSRQVSEGALRAADLAAANHGRLVEGTRQLLTALARLPEVQGDDPLGCSRVLALILRQHEYFSNLGVVGDDGYIACSAVPITIHVNAADRAYFKRAMSSGAFSAGDFQIGRITRKMQLNFGYPVRGDNGQIQGVIFAAVDLATLSRISAAAVAGLPDGTTLTMIDSRGTVLLHHPRPERWAGKPRRDTAVVSAMLAEHRGVIQAPGIDGVPRVVGFAALGLDPRVTYAHVAIGIPVEAAFAPIREALARDVVGVLAIGVALLMLALFLGDRFILRPVGRLVRATERMQHGDLSARAEIRRGLGELSALGAAFDQMAGSLERFTGQLREAEAKYRVLVEQSLAGVYVIADGRFAYINEAGARIFGYGVDEVVGKLGPLDLTHPGDRATVQQHIRARLDGSVQAVHYSFRGLRKDGGEVHVTVFGTRVDYDGHPAIMGTLIDESDRRRAEVQLERQLQQLNALRTIDMAITGSLDLRVSLAVILEQVSIQLRVDAVDVLLLDASTNTLEYAAGRGFRSVRTPRAALRLGEGYAGLVALERRPLAEPDLAHATEFVRMDLLEAEGFAAYCGVPLVAKGQIRGVLEVFHRGPLQMDRAWQSFLEALAGQAAIAVDNAVLFSDLQRANANLVLAYDSTLEGWSRALDLRDRETEGHTIRVTELTIRLARVMGMSDEEIVHVRRGALLHDIGKMGIPDRILLKPGPLTEDEWVVMRRHPVHAFELLSRIAYLRPALDIPYCHHERWDGSGYPRGLRGEDIPQAARIFAVVDAWDALCSDRPYRAAWAEEKVRDYLRASAGTLFDPAVVEVFLTLDPPRRKAVAC
jgi:PAS domain S-box-containing protein/putative nucleotidyltransferase with HDIG domain